jgi:hypothetical protein
MGLFITSQVMDSWSRGISTSPARSRTPAAGEHQDNHPGHALLQQENINITSQNIDPCRRGVSTSLARSWTPAAGEHQHNQTVHGLLQQEDINIASQIIDPLSRGNINITRQAKDSCSKETSRQSPRS